MIERGEDGGVIVCKDGFGLLTTVVVDEGGVGLEVHVRDWFVFRSRGVGG